jgi:hypothetical protein
MLSDSLVEERPPAAERICCCRSFDTPFSNPTSSRPDAAGAAALAGTANTSAPMHAATSAARDLI